LMGIEDDWNDGIQMTDLGDNQFTVTVPSLTAGDFLNYNFRRGSTFENQTPESRTYTVINGENIVNNQFGIFTNTDDIESKHYKIFPNPSADGLISLEGFEDDDKIHLYNSIGILVKSISVDRKESITLDLSNDGGGIYFLTTFNSSGLPLKTFNILIY